MDFNTGSGGTQGSGGSSSGPDSRRTQPSVGGEFNLSDPVQSFVTTVRNVVTNPVGFFSGIRRQGDLLNPLIFAVICAVVSGVLGGILGFPIALVGDAGIGVALAGLLSSIFLIPIGTVIGLFIGAGIYHLLVMLLVKPNAGFEATFRVVAYASVVQLLSWLSVIPLLGILIALIIGLYSLFLLVVGVREVHTTTTKNAVLVILIPVVVLMVLALIFGVAVAFLLRAAMG